MDASAVFVYFNAAILIVYSTRAAAALARLIVASNKGSGYARRRTTKAIFLGATAAALAVGAFSVHMALPDEKANLLQVLQLEPPANYYTPAPKNVAEAYSDRQQRLRERVGRATQGHTLQAHVTVHEGDGAKMTSAIARRAAQSGALVMPAGYDDMMQIIAAKPFADCLSEIAGDKPAKAVARDYARWATSGPCPATPAAPGSQAAPERRIIVTVAEKPAGMLSDQEQGKTYALMHVIVLPVYLAVIANLMAQAQEDTRRRTTVAQRSRT